MDFYTICWFVGQLEFISKFFMFDIIETTMLREIIQRASIKYILYDVYEHVELN
jgi:hypothetical protein